MMAPKVAIPPLLRAFSADGNCSPEQIKNGFSGDSQDAPRKRRSTRKSRSGCATCKIRRVKCDEAKPRCKRCTSTGRTCDGYRPNIEQKQASGVLVKRLPPSSEVLTPAELSALDYFHHQTAPSLSSYFDADFWTRLICQTSYVEPIIRHAMVAIGAMHAQRNRTTEGSLLTDSRAYQLEVHDDRFATFQYNKAITSLYQRMSAESCVDLALLASILFICFEFLRGDVEPAILHSKSGANIMKSITSFAAAAKSLHRVKGHLLSFFSRVEMLSTQFMDESPQECCISVSEVVPETFNSLSEARDSLVGLENLRIRFIRSIRHRKYSRGLSPDNYQNQAMLLHYLDRWAKTIDAMTLTDEQSSSSDTTPGKQLAAINTLRIRQLVSKIHLTVCTIPQECANDALFAGFETAVGLAESLQQDSNVGAHKNPARSSTFLFDMELIPSLFHIACRCRHPGLRRRAVDVLRTLKRRELTWESETAAAVAQRIIDLEQSKLTVLDGSALPAEEDRIHNTDLNSEIGIRPTKHTATFYAKRLGIDGPWTTWSEQIYSH